MENRLKKHPALAVGIGFGVVSLILNIIELVYLSAGNRLPVAVPIVLVCVSLAYCFVGMGFAGRRERQG